MARTQSNDRRDSSFSLFSIQLAATPILETPGLLINFIVDEISGACSKLWDRITSFRLFNRSSKDEDAQSFEMPPIVSEDTIDDISNEGDYATPSTQETSFSETINATQPDDDTRDNDDNESQNGEDNINQEWAPKTLSSFPTMRDLTKIRESSPQQKQDDASAVEMTIASENEDTDFEYDEDPTGNNSMLAETDDEEDTEDSAQLLANQFSPSQEEITTFADVFAALAADNQDSLLLDTPTTSTLLNRAAHIEESSTPASPQRQAIEAELAALRTPNESGYTPFKHGFNDTVVHIVEKTEDIHNIEAFLVSRYNHLGKEQIAYLMEQFYGLPEDRQAEMIANAGNYNTDLIGTDSFTPIMEIAVY